MKRLFSLVFLLLLALSLAACGPTTQSPDTQPDTTELVLLPADNAPEDVHAPDAQSDNTDAQAPPAQADGAQQSDPSDAQTTQTDAQTETPSDTQTTETTQTDPQTPETQQPETPTLDEHGTYDSKEDVALFIHLYGRLPDNYITKKEAQALGWSGGSLEAYAPGKCIGGSRFGNYEGLLPEAEGRRYTECDIDTLGAAKRGAKRIVFSNDGLIYYTGDHYETFELLYGEE